MSRNYDKYEIDNEIPGNMVLRLRKTIDAILDGGYDTSDREHLAFIICMDLQIAYFRGVSDGTSRASAEWAKTMKAVGR